MLDAMEGIAEEGTSIVTFNVREAIVRSVCMGWCKEYIKTVYEDSLHVISHVSV